MKKLGIYIVMVIAGSLLLLACNKQGNVKYFRHLRMYKIHDLDFAYLAYPNFGRVKILSLDMVMDFFILMDGECDICIQIDSNLRWLRE